MIYISFGMKTVFFVKSRTNAYEPDCYFQHFVECTDIYYLQGAKQPQWVYFESNPLPYLTHRSDSNQGSDYIAIFLSLISGFSGQHLKSQMMYSQWEFIFLILLKI